ncbi:hypothetical protein RvY_01134-3 [Ramazzottius varieornatus]|uniref:guanylate cyclase n=1 Tax=Ramazzottius varieornatus TaxID=947166 RepID=A0A1D1ULB0_RAMVA|nr:hypothetical protein RvY_01134-3 [Ramazzottius varieornatus]
MCLGSAIGPAGLAGIILGVLIVMLAIAGTLFSGFNARKAMYGVDPYWWRVRTDELQILSKKGLHAARSGGSLQDSRSVVTMDTGNTMMSSIGNQPDNVTLAMYDGNQIALTVLPSKVFKATPGLIAELNEIRTLTHPNLHRLIGICLDEQNFCEFLAQEACLKGSLEDVLENETIKLDWSFKFSLLRDLTEGMHYLHGSVIISHGLLSARNCLVDNRFMVKISNYGIRTFVPSVDFQPLEKSDEGRDFKLLLWRAPELLRQVMPPRGTQKGDVYGYGIIISQLILRCEPFDTQDSDNRARGYGGTDKEILLEVDKGKTISGYTTIMEGMLHRSNKEVFLPFGLKCLERHAHPSCIN